MRKWRTKRCKEKKEYKNKKRGEARTIMKRNKTEEDKRKKEKEIRTGKMKEKGKRESGEELEIETKEVGQKERQNIQQTQD